jgi:hypothetical protein
MELKTSATNSEPQTAKTDESSEINNEATTTALEGHQRQLPMNPRNTGTEIDARRHKLSSSQRSIPAAWVWNGLQSFHGTVFRCKIVHVVCVWGLIPLVVWLRTVGRSGCRLVTHS